MMFLYVLFVPSLIALAYTAQLPLRNSFTDTSFIRFLTYNVRYDAQPDNITINQSLSELPHNIPSLKNYYTNTTEHPWSTRRHYVASTIHFQQPLIFSGQELLHRQVQDLSTLLGRSWSYIGVGRDDGHEEGEYSPVFYRNNLFSVTHWDTFWLSGTPFEPSKYPHAGSIRTCTTARMGLGERHFTVMNTHLDEQSADQRALGASLILHRAKYEAIKTRQPVVLTGDLNSPSSDVAYKILTGTLLPVAVNETFLDRFAWTEEEEKGYEGFTMLDLLQEVKPQYRLGGNYATFTDFVNVSDTSMYERLDYIMASNMLGLDVSSYWVGSSLADDGVYASDHRPVFADLHF